MLPRYLLEGFFKNKWFQGHFPQELLCKDTSMALFELYPIVMACVLWGHNWSRKRILFHCDNLATVEIISKGRSKVKSIMQLIRRLTYHTAKNSFVVHAVHIAGVDNNIADAISRYQMRRFRALAPEAEDQPTPCLEMAHLLMD